MLVFHSFAWTKSNYTKISPTTMFITAQIKKLITFSLVILIRQVQYQIKSAYKNVVEPQTVWLLYGRNLHAGVYTLSTRCLFGFSSNCCSKLSCVILLRFSSVPPSPHMKRRWTGVDDGIAALSLINIALTVGYLCRLSSVCVLCPPNIEDIPYLLNW